MRRFEELAGVDRLAVRGGLADLQDGGEVRRVARAYFATAPTVTGPDCCAGFTRLTSPLHLNPIVEACHDHA